MNISLAVHSPIPGGVHEKLESLTAQNHVPNKVQEHMDGLDNLHQPKPPRRRRLSEADISQISLPASRKERAPKTCQVVLRYYSQYLSEYERQELLDYDHIYFFGPHARKVKGRLNDPVLNYGYDDERGDYRLVVHDHLAYRYEVLERLGQGSFGQVVRCIDHKTGHSVAVKLIRNKRRFQTQALTEVRILKKLVDWVMYSKHSVVDGSQETYHHLFLRILMIDVTIYGYSIISIFEITCVSCLNVSA